MKHQITNHRLFLISVVLLYLLFQNCEKLEKLQPPTVRTSAVTGITATEATCGGSASSTKESLIGSRGVCWATSQNPTITKSHTTDGQGASTFTSRITGLTANTSYYVRAYATNAGGTAYGSQVSFTTSAAIPPVLTTNSVTNITQTTVTCGGNITSDGGATITARGVCWSTSQNPTIANSHTSDGTGTGSFTSSITGLTANTTYYVCAYATNSAGTVYSNQVSFTTTVNVLFTTSNVTSITQTSATCGGNITSDGGLSITARGVCWSTGQNPTIANSHTSDGTGTGSFTSSITGLIANTTYYVRAYATNSAGTVYSNQVSFATTVNVLLTTSNVTSITQTSATCGGNITSDGGLSITARGVCWSTGQNPTIANSHTSDGTGTGSFTSSITGLIANTTYYVCAYATNSSGTVYGNQVNFITAPLIVTDYDGNVYDVITIGTQVWMVENLKVTHYRNGYAIPNVTDGTAWSNLTTGAYCNYNNNVNNATTYGRLYNWYAVSDSRNIAPQGWHVPTDDEWTTLETFLGSSTAGSKMKETGTTHWTSPNTGATNESGFSALPGGDRTNGTFEFIGDAGLWWSSTEYSTTNAFYRYLRYDITTINSYNWSKNTGFSIRCIRD